MLLCFSCLMQTRNWQTTTCHYIFGWIGHTVPSHTPHKIVAHAWMFGLRWWLLGLPAPNIDGATSIPWHDSERWNLWTNQEGKGYNISWYMEKVDQLIAFNFVHMFACSLSTIGLYITCRTMCRAISELFDWIWLLDQHQGIAISDALQHPWLKTAVRVPVLSVCLSLPTSVISCNSSNQARGRFDSSHVFRGDLLMSQGCTANAL